MSTKKFYAFHYESGLHTTTTLRVGGGQPEKYIAAGFVVAYDSKKERDAACNDYKSSWFNFGEKIRPVRAVTRREIVSMGHGHYFSKF